MLKKILIFCVLFYPVIALAAGSEKQDLVKHGEYLVTSHACADCHSPKKMTDKGPVNDMSRYLSGHPADEKYAKVPPKEMFGSEFGDWGGLGSVDGTVWVDAGGITFTRNLTPDMETGLGTWTEQMFMKALRTGKHMGAPEGRDIHYCMPWQAFGQMNDAELHAIWTYLRTLKPIKNAIPDPIPTETAFGEKQ
jgi:Cytochrome c